jgi:hypothetical protein
LTKFVVKDHYPTDGAYSTLYGAGRTGGSCVIDPAEFDLAAAYGPMSGLDEYLVHTTPLPVQQNINSDPRAFERTWFSCVDNTGGLLVIVGIGFYPNLGTADGYAIVNLRGQHTTVRVQRELGGNRLDMNFGPLCAQVVAPFEQWHLSLGDNPYGVQFEIDWFDSKRPWFHDSGDQIVDGTTWRSSGYESFGYQQGWVEVGGERIELSGTRFRGSRDHHWGIRENVGGPSRRKGPLAHHAHSGEFVEFGDFGIFAHYGIYYGRDDERIGSRRRTVQRRLRFDPGSKMLLGGEVDIEFESGERKHLTFERVGNQIGFLRCAMYGGFGGKGGTPDGDVWHGQFPGGDQPVVTGETYDVNDVSEQQRISGLDDCVARFECDGEIAYGIVETVHPLSYEFAREGRAGLSLVDE